MNVRGTPPTLAQGLAGVNAAESDYEVDLLAARPYHGFAMMTFIRETKGDDTDVELYRGFVFARCNTRLCARLAEGYWQRRVAEFFEDYFYERGVKAAVSEDRHITGAICCVLLDPAVKGLKRQAALLREAVDCFWDDFAGARTFDLPSGRELYESQKPGAPA